MITLTKISKKVGSRLLFDNINAAFSKGRRYGLTGPNGAGKSTLMKIMVGKEEPDEGSVTLPPKVGFLKQNIEDFKECPVLDTVIMGNTRLWSALQERDRLYVEEMTDAIGIRLGELEEMIAEEDGYSAESEAEELLVGMGLSLPLTRKKMHEIPTDSQFRVLLCQALFGHPEALLLDEPTNHLDLESIGWLEEFLHKLQRDADRHQPRPPLPQRRHHPHRRYRLRNGHHLPRQLRPDGRRQNRRPRASRRGEQIEREKNLPTPRVRRPLWRRHTRKPSAVAHPRNRPTPAPRAQKIEHPAPLHPLLSP